MREWTSQQYTEKQRLIDEQRNDHATEMELAAAGEQTEKSMLKSRINNL